ncbi:tRNA lysidine(34) synthetase TilS [Actinoplanes sp. NPDC051343]|uniref:tRNA lysidine(34) synthetase TilS n=1 Tax=Actinoplanes sp. NPDC051343 TaxID=3363906 RepID=UPI0037BCBFC4
MARIPASVAAVRAAVRRVMPADGLVLVACSGGADSLALAAAARFVGRGRGVGLVTVDHGLQEGSAQRASDVAGWARAAGFDPVVVAPVRTDGRPGGPEAAARTARYEALTAAASSHGASAVLLGHTRDDQAETVLLALARGAGPRGLAGMPVRRGILLRPLLDVARADTRKACAALGLVPWDDPHNVDPSYARARVRSDALPALVAALGPAVVDNLARSAPMIAADNEALDALASAALGEATALDVAEIGGLHTAVRRRVLHLWARRLGAPGSALSHKHVEALDALVMHWRGQGPVHLPGGILAARNRGVLVRVSE